MRVVLNGSRRQFWASGRTCSRAPQLLAGATCRPPYGSVAEGAAGVCRPAAESTHTRHLQNKSVLINWDSRHPSLWREPSNALPALSSSTALGSLKLKDPDEQTGVEILKKALLEPIRVIAENSGFEGAVILEKVTTSKEENYGFDAQSDKYGNMITMWLSQ